MPVTAVKAASIAAMPATSAESVWLLATVSVPLSLRARKSAGVGAEVGVAGTGVGVAAGVGVATGVAVGDGDGELLQAAITAGRNVNPAAPTRPLFRTSRRVICPLTAPPPFGFL